MARRSLPDHDFSDWDPMSKDYYDPNFNNYAHGPGSRLDRSLLPCHPRSDRLNAVFKLYVQNIPAGLSEIGMRNVFLNYGSPLVVYKHPTNTPQTWGLVSYGSHREAELAIRELDSVPPFYFKVKFARSTSEKERIRRQREDEEMLSRAVESEPYPVQYERSPFDSFSRGIGRGRGIPFSRHMGMARHRPGSFGHNADSDADDMDYFSPFVPGAYDETNRMIMERKMNRSFNSFSGKRWVSMGRGYFPVSERPSLDIELKKYGKDEKRMLAQSVEQMFECWFEYGQKVDGAGKSGNCSYCHRMASQYCQQCLAWYCTKSCQLKDWPRHRTVCIPKLSASDAGSHLNHAPAQVPDAKQSNETRPERSAVNQASGQNVGGSSVDFEHGDSTVNLYCQKEQSKANFKENHFKQPHRDGLSRNTDRDMNGSEHRSAHFPNAKNGRYRSSNGFSEGHMGATEGKRSSVNERLCVVRQKESGRCASLATDSMTSLQIQQDSEFVSSSIDSGQVRPVGDNMPNLSAHSQNSLSAQEDVNMPDTASTVIKMETLNISNSTSAGCSKSEELPKNRFTRTSRSAVHVEGEQNKPAAASLKKEQPHANSLPQKSNIMKQAAPRTSVSNIPMKCTPDKSPSRPQQPHRSAVDGLKVGMQGSGEFKEKMIGGDYSLTIIYSELREKFAALLREQADMKDACESSPVDEKYSPKIGDMVLAPTPCESAEDGSAWNRARILSVRNSGLYRVSFCDIGCTGTVKVVKQLSKDLASIPEFAARCSVISSAKSKEKLWSEEKREFLFTVTGVDETQMAVTCVLKSTSNEEICTALLKRWVPAVEDEGLKTVEVKNNDSVVLQVFFNQKSLFVRPASSSAKDMFCQLNQDIGQHCLKAVEIDHLPVKNELVACRFLADGNYYRAKVLDVSANTVKVAYVDYGNMDSATKDRLKPLTDSLKRIPCMAVKVGLKDAVDRPLTVDANEFISDLVGREVELKLILTGSRKDEVQLILPDGSSVNDVWNTMLEPGWKKAMAAGKDPRESGTFMANDIKYLELPVGQTVDFLVLHKLDSVNVMGCESDGETVAYVHGHMTSEMNKYCESTPEKSYVPRYSELCFAKYEGIWYRAVCLRDELARDKNVIYLDFGNMAYVEKENIRKMIKDYIETPAVALMCSLQGLENANETLKNRVCELVQVNKTYKARVVSCHNPGSYVIEFPHVTEALIKENLLPSEK